jgi:methionine-rich copper-binding protein CopC
MNLQSSAVRVRQFGLTTVLAGAAVALFALPAAAHSELISASPAQDSVLTDAPSQVVLTFNENIIAIGDQVSVTDQSGASVSDGTPKVVDSTVTESLKSLTYNGKYLVTYRIVSADGHPVEKSYNFTLNAAGLQQPSASAKPTESKTSSGLSFGVIAAIVGGVFVLAVVVGIISVFAGRADTKDEDAGPDNEAESAAEAAEPPTE